MRDHLALPLERRLAFLSLASGRGVLYCGTGLLAFDTQERLQMAAGGAMLAFGAVNLLLGSLTAVKLKRMRRGLRGAAPMLTSYRSALGRAANADGLAAAECAALFAEFGVAFGRWGMQAVFLEIDHRRCGLVDEAALLRWYHGHIGRTLKHIAKTPPPNPRPTYRGWLCRCPGSAYDVSVWGSVLMLVMMPTTRTRRAPCLERPTPHRPPSRAARPAPRPARRPHPGCRGADGFSAPPLCAQSAPAWLRCSTRTCCSS